MHEFDNSSVQVSFLTTGDPTDRRTWSGVPHSMIGGLRQHFDNLSHYVPLTAREIQVVQAYCKLQRQATGSNFPVHLSPIAAAITRRRIVAQTNANKPDAVIAVTASAMIGYLPKDVPIIYLSDGTF
jgi:hypothetical protein